MIYTVGVRVTFENDLYWCFRGVYFWIMSFSFDPFSVLLETLFFFVFFG